MTAPHLLRKKRSAHDAMTALAALRFRSGIGKAANKRALFAAVFLSAAALFGAPERLEWDFRQPSGRTAGGEPLENSRITSEGLRSKTAKRRFKCGFKVTPGTVKAPDGAFRVTVGFIPEDIGLNPYMRCDMILFDTMGPFRYQELRRSTLPEITGFQLNLREAGKNRFRPVVNLGYGRDIARIAGEVVTLPPGVRAAIAFECDGLSVCRIFVNGQLNTLSTISALPLPGRDAYIGGGVPVNTGFTGIVTDAAIEYFPKPDFALAAVANRTFIRGEKASVQLEFRTGNRRGTFSALELEGEFSGRKLPPRRILPDRPFALAVETNLRPGRYPLKLRVSGVRDGEKFTAEHTETLTVAPAPANEMPVMIWGGYPMQYPEPFRELGFNRAFFEMSSYLPLEKNLPTLNDCVTAVLDRFAAAGMRVMEDIDLTNYRLVNSMVKRNPVRGRDNRARPIGGRPMPDPTAREVVDTMCGIAFADGVLRGRHPAVFGALLNTERRDRLQPALDGQAEARYRQASGRSIPAEVEIKTAPSHQVLKDIPPNRIVPDNHPLLKYYQWYWRGGDGFHALNAAMDNAYKAGAGKDGLATMFDPAVRVPPIWGGGGSVDIINQWVYAYPEPFRVAAVAGEVQAMADEKPGQKISIMTQLIVKRFELVNAGMKVKKTPAWFRRETAGIYLTTPPDLLREATWAMLARRTDAIMYYGRGALIPSDFMFTGGLRCTDTRSAEVLGEVLNNVVNPLGPTLVKLPERAKDTAVYESFAASIFAGRGGWGWGDEWPTGMLMYRANLAPRTLYDEHIRRGALENIKVLFMPHCDVIAASAAKEIRKFQKRGGIVVADEHLAPGITPDIEIPAIVFDRNAGARKFNFQYKQAAAELLRKLASHYRPFATADPEFFTFPRRYKDADYLFVINDRRTYGGYFGVWRQVMEKGLPHAGEVAVNRPAAAVYELSRGGSVKFRSSPGKTSVRLDFAANDGRLLLFLASPITRVELDVPETAAPGATFTVTAKVFDASGKTVPALLPAELVVTAPDGRKLDGSGFECAVDGVLKKEFRLALNDPPGVWSVRFADRASTLSKLAKITVKGR